VKSKKTAPLALRATELFAQEIRVKMEKPVKEAHLAFKTDALRMISLWNCALLKKSSAIS
jgi:hypothetical protein